MASRTTPGTCLLCREEVNKKESQKHATACLQSSGWSAGLLPSFIISVEDSRDPFWWLKILARHGAETGDLDHLLRDVWMESGTEPGEFTIRNMVYCSTGNGMDVPLVNLLEEGDSFSYEYGMYMHTNLRLRVQGTTMVMPPGVSLCLIARNNPSFPRCSVCGADAQYVASKTRNDETAEYYCLNCLMALGEAFVQLIENSPRKSVCASPENLNEMIKWYPPGWEIQDLASPEMFAFMMAGENEEEDVDDIISTVFADLGGVIPEFIREEVASCGEDMATLSGEISMEFCIILLGLHGKRCDEWDAPLLRMFLSDEFVLSPNITDEWHDNIVPVLCRFLAHLEKCGRISNAAELIDEVKEAEPIFLELAGNPEDAKVDILMEQAMPDDDLHATCRENLKSMAQSDSPPEEAVPEDIFGGSLNALIENHIRCGMIAERCEDFCTRLEDEDVLERCREIVFSLGAHPDRPLSRGDGLLWSAAIVYAACREEKIIGKAKGGSPLAREICVHFNRELSSIRNRVTVLRKRLAECPEEEFPFTI